MADLKMRASPYFVHILEAVNTMVEKGLFKKHYDNWMDVLTEYVSVAKSSQNRSFDSYVLFQLGLFEKNAIRSKEIREIQKDTGKVKILVIPTNEELEIAKETYDLLK